MRPGRNRSAVLAPVAVVADLAVAVVAARPAEAPVAAGLAVAVAAASRAGKLNHSKGQPGLPLFYSSLYSSGSVPALQKRAQAMAPAGMPQLAECLRFNLPDPLPRDCEVLSDFLERMLASIFEAETHLDDFLFARRERLEHLRGLLAQIQIDYRVRRRNPVLIDDEVTQVRLLLFADRRLQRDRLLRDPQHLPHLRHR